MTSKVFIATPAYLPDHFSMEHVSSMLHFGILLTDANVGVIHCICPGNPFIDAARNSLVDEFMKTDCDSLLFIDADVGFDAKAAMRVLHYPQEVVGGLVPKRAMDTDSSYHQNAMTGNMSKEGLFQAIELPTAFMRIKRSAFAKLQKPYFKTGSRPEDFGEDIYFCRRWCELGEFVWIDTDITFTHRGSKAWKGNFYDHCLTQGLIKIAPAQAA